MPKTSSFEQSVISCNLCPRLRKHCQKIAQLKRRAYQDESYWGRPVPPFGDPRGKLLVVGLAPGAHGANRTGRVFTGDRSGEWLYLALNKAGFANQSLSHSRNDGLKLLGARVTCVVKCAPPENKPTPQEISQCTSQFLRTELESSRDVRVYVALGKIAWDTLQKELKPKRKVKFRHGAESITPDGRRIIASYHPSQQNTFTGKLTESMFDEIFSRARALLNSLEDI